MFSCLFLEDALWYLGAGIFRISRTLTNRLRDLMLGIPCTTNSALKQKELICASSEVFYEHYSHFPTCTSIYILNGLVSEPPTPASRSPWAEQRRWQKQKKSQIHTASGPKLCRLAALPRWVAPGAKCTQQRRRVAADVPSKAKARQKHGKSKSKA